MPAARWLLLLLYAASMEECAAWEPQGGRGYWQQAVNTVSLSVCLFVRYCVRRPGLGGFKAARETTSVLRVWSAVQPCQDTSRLTIAALNQYFPPSHTGLFHWQEFKNGQALIEKRGKNVGVDRREGPVAFFQSTTIRNRFLTISLNLLAGLLTKNTVTEPFRQPNENNYYWLCLTVIMKFLYLPQCNHIH